MLTSMMDALMLVVLFFWCALVFFTAGRVIGLLPAISSRAMLISLPVLMLVSAWIFLLWI